MKQIIGLQIFIDSKNNVRNINPYLNFPLNQWSFNSSLVYYSKETHFFCIFFLWYYFSKSFLLCLLCQCGCGPYRLLHCAGRHVGHGGV